MVITLGPPPVMVTMLTVQRSSGGTTISCLTSMTPRRLPRTLVPRAAAVGIPSPRDRWSPPSRSVNENERIKLDQSFEKIDKWCIYYKPNAVI